MFFKKIPAPQPPSFLGSITIEKEGEKKILSTAQFEALLKTRFVPHLEFSDGSLLRQITRQTLKFHQAQKLSRTQLWHGSYYRKEILEPTLPPLAIRWINSQIGWGVFSTRRIPKMSFIGEYAGLLRKRKRADKKNAYCFEYILAEGIDSPYIIDARDQGGIVRYINHSTQANLTASLATVDHITHIILIAKETIEAGDQLFYDYGPNYWTYRPKPVDLEGKNGIGYSTIP